MNTNDNQEVAEDFEVEVEEVEEQEEEQDQSTELARKLAEAEKRLATTIAQKKHLQKKLQDGGAKETNYHVEGLTQREKDVRALNMSNVYDDDDVDIVVNWAKVSNISISEALKSDVIKTMLRQNEEFRKTAEATNTKTARKGPDRIDERVVVANAREGKMPTTPEEAEALFYARRGGKR